MKRTITAMAAIAGVGLVLTACGESASESAIEEILEEAAGGDAEIDLSDGEIKVQTPEGEVKIDIDEDDGSFEMEVDGEKVVDAQVDDSGDGDIKISTDDGEATIDVNEDGEGSMEISSDDGDTSMDISTGEGEVPDDWPAEIPTPDGLDIENASSFTSGDDYVVTVTGKAPGQDWVESYGSAVEEAGFSEATRMESSEALNLFYEAPGWAVTVFGVPSGDGQWDVVVSATVVPE